MSDRKYRFNFGLGEAGNEERTRKPGIFMVCGFTLMMLLMIALMISIMLVRLNTALEEQSSKILGGYNKQIAITVDEYFENISRNVNMIFSNENYYTYDPTLTLGSVDAVTEAKITSDLSVYASMNDYRDFCISYPFGHTVGQLSDKTWNLYGMDMYDKLSEKIRDKSAMWLYNIDDDYFYYIHRINENAIMVASVESDVIKKLINDECGLDNSVVYLTNESMIVQITTGKQDEVGSYLKSDIYRLANKNGGIKKSRLYYVATQGISNGWFIVMAIPYASIIEGVSAAQISIMTIGLIMLVVAVCFTIMMTRRMILNINRTVGRLDEKSQSDLLTGLLNKKSFEDTVNLMLSENFDQCGYALVFMDVDNFKGVNDRCGHDIGDEVLVSFSHTIGSVFRGDDIKGRLGGDEFCVLMKLSYGLSMDEMTEAVNDVCGRFRDALHRKSSAGRQSIPAVTSSMGVAISTNNTEGFDDLYHKADTALYHSKHKGKDTWSIYGEE